MNKVLLTLTIVSALLFAGAVYKLLSLPNGTQWTPPGLPGK